MSNSSIWSGTAVSGVVDRHTTHGAGDRPGEPVLHGDYDLADSSAIVSDTSFGFGDLDREAMAAATARTKGLQRFRDGSPWGYLTSALARQRQWPLIDKRKLVTSVDLSRRASPHERRAAVLSRNLPKRIAAFGMMGITALTTDNVLATLIQGSFSGVVNHTTCRGVGCTGPSALPPPVSNIGIGDLVSGTFQYDPTEFIADGDGSTTGPNGGASEGYIAISPATSSMEIRIENNVFKIPRPSDDFSIFNIRVTNDIVVPHPTGGIIGRDGIELRLDGFPADGLSSDSFLVVVDGFQVEDPFGPQTGIPSLNVVASTSLPADIGDLNVTEAVTLAGEIRSSQFVGSGVSEWRIQFDIDPETFNLAPPPPSPPELVAPKPGVLVPTVLDGVPGSPFDPNKPTIVITHGWQPSGPTFWWEDMAAAIAARPIAGGDPSGPDTYGDVYNIVQYVWSDAFDDIEGNVAEDPFKHRASFNAVKPTVNFNGAVLGSALATLLGTGYDEDIHFIGHSFGTIVNAAAVQQLAKVGIPVEQFTILDAPLRGPLVLDYQLDYFRRVLPAGTVHYVDNYFGQSGFGAVGDRICPLAFNRDCAFNALVIGASHSGVRDVYLNTITSTDARTGFYYDRLGGGFNERPNSPWSPGDVDPLDVLGTVNPTIGPAWLSVGDVEISVDSIGLTTGSPAGVVSSVLTIPHGTEYLVFDFVVGQLLDHFLSVFLDDVLVFVFSDVALLEPGINATSGLIPVHEYAGGDHTLAFWFDGTERGTIRLSNIQFVGTLAQIPEPSTVLLLATATLFLFVRQGRFGSSNSRI